MAELEANLLPYDFEATLAVDRVDTEKCLVLNVGLDNNGESVASLKHIEDKVHEYFLHCHDLKVPVSKLYIMGYWHLDPASLEASKLNSSEESYNEQMEYRRGKLQEEEMAKAGGKIMELIVQMPKLKELTWVSKLPVIPAVLEKLPPLTKLVLDLGQPVRLNRDGALLRRSYIAPNEMNVLQQQTQLKELRLFRMHDSFQPIVWETVFRNKSEGGMRVVDLQMFAAPLIRAEWRKGNEVDGLIPLHLLNEVLREKEYKGTDGKGILHYSFGTGEYLDDFCMRRARIASGLNEAKPAPLYCLKLDGFVIDHLPFLSELSHLVLLSCGRNCVDAGLQTPTADLTVPNEWSKTVDDATARCLIQWPTWIGAFDDQGQKMDVKIDLPRKPQSKRPGFMSMEEFEEFRREHLTKEALEMKEQAEKLEGEKFDGTTDNLNTPPPSNSTNTSSMVVEHSLRTVSNTSTHGSEVPDTPVIASTDGPQSVPSIDGFALSSDARERVIVPVMSAESSFSPPANDDVFDGSPGMDLASNAFTVDSEDIAAANAAVKSGSMD